MRRYVIAYVATLVCFSLLDFAWLGTAASRLYRPRLGALLAPQPLLWAAAAFYLLYPACVVILAGTPAFRSGSWMEALALGALCGFFAYMTYDLSNMATLSNWSVTVTLVDIAWGTLLTGASSALGFAAARSLGG